MIIFVTGEDQFSAKEHVAAMKNRFVEKYDASGMNVEEFSGKLELGKVLASACSPGFLSDRRMVIVRGLLSQVTRKPDAKPWLERLETVPQENIVIFVDDISEKKVARHALYKGLLEKDGVHTYHFPVLSSFEAVKKMKAVAASESTQVSDDVLRALVSRVGVDMWQLSGELKKVQAYAHGRPVTKEDVDLLVSANSDDAMFDLLDAISTKNRKKASELLATQRDFGTSDFQLFAMLSRQVRLLIAVSQMYANGRPQKQEVAKELGVHPFVAQKLLQQAAGFDFTQLKAVHALLNDYDGRIKSGKIDVTTAVDRLFFAIIRPESLTK